MLWCWFTCLFMLFGCFVFLFIVCVLFGLVLEFCFFAFVLMFTILFVCLIVLSFGFFVDVMYI